MLSQRALDEAVRAAGIEAPPVFREETGSTNSDALDLAASGAPGWTVVATNHQTAGRGRLGRSWASEPGRLLQLSVILRPELPPERAALISLLAAVAMAEACRTEAGVEVAAKWPNDLVAGKRKLGGILAEAVVEGGRVAHVVLGTGVNVSMRPGNFPPELRGRATSLAMEGAGIQPVSLVRPFLERLGDALSRPLEEGLARYRRICATLGRRVRATTTDGRAIEGIAGGLSDDGALIVDGTPVAFGEVVHLE